LEGGVIDAFSIDEHHSVSLSGHAGFGGVQHFPGVILQLEWFELEGEELPALANPLDERGMALFEPGIAKCLDDLLD
jgi:hypothetical protein